MFGACQVGRTMAISIIAIVKPIHQLNSTWNSPYVLVYMGPLLTYLFDICAMYIDYRL